MAYQERNAWSSLIASLGGVAVYAIIMATQLSSSPIEDIDWFWPMLWTVAGSIVGAVVVSIFLGILANAGDRGSANVSDVRDREIAHTGDRVGQAFLVIGGVTALLLCAAEVDWFWIGNAVYLGFAMSAILGGLTRVIVYRRGMA
jgi:MFS family permease